MSLSFDFYNKIININLPQTELLIQELIDEIRYNEQTEEGIQYKQIAEASGKEILEENIYVGITVQLLNNWQLKFENGTYIAKVYGGNLVGGINNDPIAYSPGVQVLLIQSAASTIVISGSGVTHDDKDDIIQGVWNELSSDYNINGTFGKNISDIKSETDKISDIHNKLPSGQIADSQDSVDIINIVTENNSKIENIDNKIDILNIDCTSINYKINIINNKIDNINIKDIEISNDLKKILGLVHENIFIDLPSYDNDNNLISARIRTYSNKYDVGSNNNIIETYLIESDSSGPGKFNNWKQIIL